MTNRTIPQPLDLRGKTITTYIVFEICQALELLEQGQRLDVVTDVYPAIESDIRAWCRVTGNELVAAGTDVDRWRITIENGPPFRSEHGYAAIISDDGLLELLSPLGFALGAALEGHDVVLYFQGPAVRVLAKGFTAKMHGAGRVFSRFPRNGLARSGHLAPQDKIGQLIQLGARIYACGPSMQHYRVAPEDLAFDDVTVAEYLTFIEQMDGADMQLVS
jgi:predicted peroxiredoxin/TusA-related sulfurtransferase